MRPIAHYKAAFVDWLATASLNAFERDVVDRMGKALDVSEQAFWDCVEETKLYLAAPLHSAMMKALAEGRCLSWSSILPPATEPANAAA